MVRPTGLSARSDQIDLNLSVHYQSAESYWGPKGARSRRAPNLKLGGDRVATLDPALATFFGVQRLVQDFIRVVLGLIEVVRRVGIGHVITVWVSPQ